MAPPQLSTDWPIAFFAQPIEIALRITLWQDFDLASGDGIHGALSQLFHLDEPLISQERFYRCLAAIAVGEFDFAIFDIAHQTEFFQVGDDSFASLANGQAFVLARFGVHGAVGVQDVDHRQVASQGNFVIVWIVSWGDLNAAGTEFGLGPCIGDQRDLTTDQGQLELRALLGHFSQLF